MKKDYDELIRKFKKGQVSRRELISDLGLIIAKIPIFMKCYDKDLKNDFFLHVIASIDKTLSKYEPVPNCKFETWFIFVLKRNFIQYSSREQLKKQKIKAIENINDFEESSPDYYYIPETVKNSPQINIKSLNEIELKILALKFGIGLPEEVTSDEVLKKLSRKMAMEDRLSNTYNKLLLIQETISNTLSPEKLKALRKKESAIKRNKRNNEKYYNSISLTPSNKWISNQLNISEGAVSAYLSRLKKKIKDDYILNNKDYFDKKLSEKKIDKNQ